MGKEMSKILPGLYIGRLENAQNDSDMMACCITHILSIHEPVEQKLIKSKSYNYYNVNVQDKENVYISKHFPKTNDFIHKARKDGGNVLVHCLAGVSRAPTVVIAYIMAVYNFDFMQAYNCLRAVNKNVKPNPGFFKQLQDYEQTELYSERMRIINTFGHWQQLEVDLKVLNELLNKFEAHQNNYIDSSMESSLENSYNIQHFNPYNPETVPDVTDDDNIIIDFDERNEVDENVSDELSSQAFGSNDEGLEEDNEKGKKEEEEDGDIPGSIPIQGDQKKYDTMNKQMSLTATDCFRGRAHSRLLKTESGGTETDIDNRNRSITISGTTVCSDGSTVNYGRTAPQLRASDNLILYSSDQ